MSIFFISSISLILIAYANLTAIELLSLTVFLSVSMLWSFFMTPYLFVGSDRSELDSNDELSTKSVPWLVIGIPPDLFV